jgi:hypothetical protein
MNPTNRISALAIKSMEICHRYGSADRKRTAMISEGPRNKTSFWISIVICCVLAMGFVSIGWLWWSFEVDVEPSSKFSPPAFTLVAEPASCWVACLLKGAWVPPTSWYDCSEPWSLLWEKRESDSEKHQRPNTEWESQRHLSRSKTIEIRILAREWPK